jgi:hypothetical protein
VQLGHRVDEREADPAADVVVMLQARRHHGAHHLASPALHHEEVGAEHCRVVAEEVGTRCPIEVTPESRQHLVLAPHIVSAGGDLTHRRPAQHQIMRADAKQIGQVRRSVRELENLERPLGAEEHRGEPRTEPGVEDLPVQLLARAHGCDLGRVSHRDVVHVPSIGPASREWAARRWPCR